MATTAPTTAVDERLRQTPWIRRVMARPELGAVAGTVLVFIFFAFVAGGSGMFTALGVINFLEVSAQLGIIAVAACMLMIGGEFDLSIGSMIGAAGVIIAIPAVQWGLPLWLCILLAFAIACLVGYVNGQIVIRSGLPSFIVTLAGLFILRGLTIGFTRMIIGLTPTGWHRSSRARSAALSWSGSPRWGSSAPAPTARRQSPASRCRSCGGSGSPPWPRTSCCARGSATGSS